MKLSTKGHYAVLALADLALHNPGCIVPIHEIAERQNIPQPYLEQLLMKLRRQGIIQSVRGKNGGYTLKKDHHLITVSQIIAAVEEPIQSTQCGGSSKVTCNGAKAKCLIHGLWSQLDDVLHKYLSNVTLHDVISGKFDKSKSNSAYLE